MTDLEKILEKINYANKQNFISQKETDDLKKMARSLATQKGSLGEKERNKINQTLNDALNKKGKEVKSEGGLKPPTSGGNPTVVTRTGVEPTKETGGEKWDKFKKGYSSLKSDDDKKFIRNVFGGIPRDDNLANWQTLSDGKKNALVNAVNDGKITQKEKDSLKGLFKEKGSGSGDGQGGGSGQGGQGDGSGQGAGGGDDEDFDVEGDGGGGSGDEPGDEPVHGGPNPAQKGGGKKVNVPKNENRANDSVPKNSKERITMPNIDKKIIKEVQRITKQLISSTKEFIEGGINYDGIDFIPDNEILTENGESAFSFNDFNAPGTVNSGLADERMNDIEKAINDLLAPGLEENSNKNNNYSEYIDLFELRYNNNGVPYYRFSIELEGEIVEDIVVTVLNNRSLEEQGDGG